MGNNNVGFYNICNFDLARNNKKIVLVVSLGPYTILIFSKYGSYMRVLNIEYNVYKDRSIISIQNKNCGPPLITFRVNFLSLRMISWLFRPPWSVVGGSHLNFAVDPAIGCLPLCFFVSICMAPYLYGDPIYSCI